MANLVSTYLVSAFWTRARYPVGALCKRARYSVGALCKRAKCPVGAFWTRACIAITAMLVCGMSVHAEVGYIHGRLTDKKLDKPLAAHPVTLNVHRANADVETQETVTDENGDYRFDELPLDPSLHYTVATTYEGSEYTEEDLVLSTWAPNLTVNLDIGAMSNDRSKIRVKTHMLFIGPPPEDHAPDGAVSVREILQVENQDNLPFQTVHGGKPVGLHLGLPRGHEGFQSRTSHELAVSPATNQVVMTTPLPPGQLEFGYVYILHVEDAELDLSRLLQFDTEHLYILVPERFNLRPQSKRFGEPRREAIHNLIYNIYSNPENEPFPAGARADLTLKFGVASQETSADLGQMALIAVAAALTGGFFVAALFMLRNAHNRSKTSETAETHEDAKPDAGWLGKLNDEDLEDVRVARLEFITYLDDARKNQHISERVYNRLRREQTERLSATLNQRKARGLE